MSMFPMMADLIPEGSIGEARVEHFGVSEADSRMTAIRAMARPMEYVPPGRYARLYVGGRLVMSDTAMERRTNLEVVRRANGRVLIGGLGLGMILAPILAGDDVSDVVVVEQSPDVVALVAPHLASSRLKVVVGDVMGWRPARGERFDTIYNDIWPDICTDNIREINALHRRQGRWLDPDNPRAWVGSWMHDELKRRRRREKRHEWAY